MSYKDIITEKVSSRLKNPIIKVLKEIKIDKILKKSNFVKKRWSINFNNTFTLYFYDCNQ